MGSTPGRFRQLLVLLALVGLCIGVGLLPLILAELGLSAIQELVPLTIRPWWSVYVFSGVALAIGASVGFLSETFAARRALRRLAILMGGLAATCLIVFAVRATVTVDFLGAYYTHIIGFGRRLPSCAEGAGACKPEMSDETCIETTLGARNLEDVSECWGADRIRFAQRSFWLAQFLSMVTLGLGAGLLTRRSQDVARRAAGLERFIRAVNPLLDPIVFREGLERVEDAVCRIQAGRVNGTGFLVGPDLVMTNYHVVEQVIRQKVSPSAVVLRFDYRRWRAPAPQEGREARLVAGEGWLVAASPYAPDEGAGDHATPEQLDFALLRLAAPVSTRSGATRPWLAPYPEHPFPEGAPLLIVQHPAGRPLALAMDTEAILGVNEARTRVRYRTNTEAGSSGAPCFDEQWRLIAIHHFGDPSWAEPTYNKGIPIAAIMDYLQRHHAELLPLPPPPAADEPVAPAAA